MSWWFTQKLTTRQSIRSAQPQNELCITSPPQGSGIISEEERRKKESKTVLSGDDRTIYAYRFTAAMARCTGPAQEQASQHSRMESLGGDTQWLLREEGHFSLKAWLLVGQPYSSGWSHTQYLDNTNKFMGCFKKEWSQVKWRGKKVLEGARVRNEGDKQKSLPGNGGTHL